LIRKPSAFVSSIVDERGDELQYAGMKISEVFRSNLGVGGVLGLIWFRKRLPEYFCRFIELVLMVTADHGPAVAGAHNTIVCARAGKDLISSLCSGLLTIGPRFGGALDGAAEKFSWAYDSGLSPEDYVNSMRYSKEHITGIGHRIKSLENPDARVVIVKNFVRAHFKSTELFDYACEVEKVTTKKKSNLILNVDGAIACAFVDLLRSCGAFTLEESNDYVKQGTLNGLFVLGRTIGFIGHFIDQNRLKQGLYRHPTEDISYLVDQALTV
jgi:ATP citrate (pro-S)-lyase